MTRKNIIDYLNAFYNPANGVIVIAGKIPKNIKSVLNKYFIQKSSRKEKVTERKFELFSNKQKQARLILNHKDTKQVHLAMGFPAYSYDHPDLHALYMLAVILGGNMSSRLFINLREKKGLCYYIKAQADIYQDTGNLMIRSGLDINKIKEAIKIINKELKQIRDKGISQAELKMAQEFLKGRITLQLEESNNLAEFHGKQFILTDKILSPEERFKKFSAVTKSQVNKVAQDIIKTEKLNLAMISPFKNEKEFLKLLKI